MNYAKINTCDIANGVGVRVSVFVSGCRRHCPGCHNPQAWNFGYGELYTTQTAEHIRNHLEAEYIDGITILGGEPFEPENIPSVADIVEIAADTGKTVWIYTGYTLETLKDRARYEREIWYILDRTDVLVDGAFVEELHDITLKFRGSSNQRIIDVPATLAAGEVILWRET